jgi:hypothetical protein
MQIGFEIATRLLIGLPIDRVLDRHCSAASPKGSARMPQSLSSFPGTGYAAARVPASSRRPFPSVTRRARIRVTCPTHGH